MPHRWVLIGGELGQRSFEFDQTFTVGRQSGCDIRLPSSKVSRIHCTVERSADDSAEPVAPGPLWVLKDLDSRNGTFVNGVPVTERALALADRVSISSWTFRVEPERLNEDASAGVSLLDGGRTQELSIEDGLYFDPERLAAGVQAAEMLDLLLRLGRQLQNAKSAQDLSSSVLPMLLEGTSASRVLLRGFPELEGAARSASLDLEVSLTGSESEAPIDDALLTRSLEERRAILVQPPRDSGTPGSVMVVPLMADAETCVGALYLESTPGASPLDAEHMRLVTAFAGSLAPALIHLRYRLWLEQSGHSDSGSTLVGESMALERVCQAGRRVAPTDTSVLLLGESGTGKELLAREIHQQSGRSAAPFVAVNCAAVSESLLDSELFGHERGAFTGAVKRHVGRFELAHGGTLFLDEIGEMPPPLQAKLLRAIELREFERVGGSQTLKVDLRLVCATNRNLAKLVEEGRFREDLYYRVNVVSLLLPPLRERGSDVALLARHFVRLFAQQLGRPGLEISSSALAVLTAYPWPGNVRELRNAIERAAVLSAQELLDPSDFNFLDRSVDAPGKPVNFREAVAENKKRLIRTALAGAGGKVTAAAAALGLSPNYLHRLMSQLRLRD